MKAHMIAAIVLACASISAFAQEQGAEPVDAVAGAEPAETAAAGEVYKGTYEAGSQLLIDITTRVGGELDLRLEQDMGGEDDARPQTDALLVSSH